MATRKTKSKTAKRTTRASASESRVTVDRGEKTTERKTNSDGNFLDKIQNDLEKNQSYLNLILGALIVVVLGVLIFNYFNRPADETGNVTPVAEQTTDENGDVKKENLPGKYTVKEGDTLFTIAQKYYDKGDNYTEISEANSLTNDAIEVGQELTIPKLESAIAEASASPAASDSGEIAMASTEPSTEPSASPSSEPVAQATPEPQTDSGTGGAENATTWGEAINGDTYTVQANDWLSKIAGRAYGDITKYQAIAQANNISNPDSIEVGVVLKIPRN